MRRETLAENDMQKRVQHFCNFEKPRYNVAFVKRICTEIVEEDYDRLKGELCEMYKHLPGLSTEQMRCAKIAEWITDLFLKLKGRYPDRIDLMNNIVYALNKQMRLADELCEFRQADTINDIILVFTKEIGRIRNERKEEKHHNEEYISEEDISELSSLII